MNERIVSWCTYIRQVTKYFASACFARVQITIITSKKCVLLHAKNPNLIQTKKKMQSISSRWTDFFFHLRHGWQCAHDHRMNCSYHNFPMVLMFAISIARKYASIEIQYSNYKSVLFFSWHRQNEMNGEISAYRTIGEWWKFSFFEESGKNALLKWITINLKYAVHSSVFVYMAEARDRFFPRKR